MWTRIWAISVKEWIQIRRDPRTLGVVFLMPIIMLFIYGYGVNFDLRHLPFAVRDVDRTATSRALIEKFRQSDYFDWRGMIERPSEVEDLFQRNRVRFVMEIPRGFAEDISAGRATSVQIIINGDDANTASVSLGYTNGVIQTFSREQTLSRLRQYGKAINLMMTPIDVRSRVLYNPELKSTHFIVPGLIAVILTMLAALLTSATVVRERERGTIEALVASPMQPIELMVGKLIPYVLMSLGDVALVTAMGLIVFGVPLVGSVTLLFVMSLLFLLGVLGMGLFISTIAPTQQLAIVGALLSTMLPSILLSGFVFPRASMPLALQLIGNLFPTTYFLVIVRGIFLKGVGLEVLWKQALALLIYAALTLFLSAKRFKKRL
jgi:ABC-2 type transport system permease protein